MTTASDAAARTYQVRTYGCQMNVHDSARTPARREGAGSARAPDDDPPAVVVSTPCAVGETADNRLYGNLGHLRPTKLANPGMQIAVGGCLAQKDRGESVARAPRGDGVFGTDNIGSLPVRLERARPKQEAAGEKPSWLEGFPLSL